MAAELNEVMDGILSDGLATGWQVWGVGPSGVVDRAGGKDGLGQAVTTDSMFRTYCATKPLLALLCGVLVTEGELSFDDRLGDLLPIGGVHAQMTVEEILRHRTGLEHPNGIVVSTLRAENRLSAVLEHGPVVPPIGRSETAYSEAATWILLGEAVSTLVSGTLADAVRELVLAPLRLEHEFDLADGGPTSRLALNISLRPGRAWPLLIERGEALAWPSNPGYGGAATCRGLAGLAAAANPTTSDRQLALNGGVMRQMLTGVPRHDRVLGRLMTFGQGWMLDLPAIDFGHSVSAEAFGHVGLTGMTALWCDPIAMVAAAWHVNGLVDGETMVTWLRPRITEATMESLR